MTIAENIANQAAELQKQRDAATARIDTLVTEHAAAIAAKDSEHAAALAAKDAELATARQQYAELSAYKTAMEQRVSEVLQSGDPAQYEALAQEFLTPAQEKARQEKLEQLETLKAQAAALEAELAG